MMSRLNNIIVAEDNDLIRGMLLKFFSKLPHRVTAVPNGHEALKLMGKKHYDILLTDYNMAGTNGEDLVKETRRLYPRCQIIGMSSENVRDIFLAAGAGWFLEKPLDLEQLRSLINDLTASP